ncbi:MAG: TylF/MycF/NovP-related O-methyltransferase [Xanthobacteraceae bacterium]
MSEAAIDRLRSRYLDLVEKSVANAIYGESELEMRVARWRNRLRHPYLTRHLALAWPARAHTMIGLKRLRNVRDLAERTIRESIAGDYIETGVWRGGACILMRAVLKAFEVDDRRVICADSFAGLPPPDPRKYKEDRRDRLHRFDDLAVSEQTVRDNFKRYDLLDEQVVFLKGLFKDTLPQLKDRRFSLIRLDGDMYESTTDALINLYDCLSEGGFLIVDDYGALKSCRAAVHDFLDRRSLQVDMQMIDDSAVWWRKA